MNSMAQAQEIASKLSPTDAQALSDFMRQEEQKNEVQGSTFHHLFRRDRAYSA
jgi:hypothetical protein